MISQEFLEIVVCPKCKGDLEYQPSDDGKNGEFLCRACQLSYAISDDIPNLIIEDAKPLQKVESE